MTRAHDATASTMEWWPIENVKPNPRNSRVHPASQIADIRVSLREYGQVWPVLVEDDGTLIAGEGRWVATKAEGFEQIKVLRASNMTDRQKRAFMVADNRLPLDAQWDDAKLKAELEWLLGQGQARESLGFSKVEVDRLLAAEGARQAGVSLRDRFGVVPFSVFSARDGWWQARKQAWIALGIQSELGRGGNLIGRSLHDRLAIILGVHYSEVSEFIEERRRKGLDDPTIEAEARQVAGQPERFAAIPGKGAAATEGAMMPLDRAKRGQAVPGGDSRGGVGKNSVWRDRDNLGKADARPRGNALRARESMVDAAVRRELADMEAKDAAKTER